MNQPDRKLAAYRRLARRNLPSLLTYKFLNEYGYDKGEVVVKAIVDDICDTIRLYHRGKDELEPGQLIYLTPHKDERGGPGKTMAKTRLVPVVLTIVAQEDIEAVREGAPADRAREMRIRRLSHEAYQQEGVLSQRDVAIVTGYPQCQVSRIVIALRKNGELLPLRGYVCDMGSWPTHKVAIVSLYLQDMLTPDIARRTYHTKESVDRYIRGFERVRILAPKFPREELPLLTGMAQRVIDEYLELIDEHDAQSKKEVRSDASASS